MRSSRDIAVLGRQESCQNYVRFLARYGFHPIVTLSPDAIGSCGGLLLPGGGDVTPAFFGQKNKGSEQIDTELDILQFQILELCIRQKKPVLGICKGMQLINIAFGGTIVQDMTQARLHKHPKHDLCHDTVICENPILPKGHALVNSCHHQCLDRIGGGLSVIEESADHCPEAILHDTLPILGVQWHPERFYPKAGGFDPSIVLSIFDRET